MTASTTSQPAGLPVARGAQRPRISSVPAYASSAGAEAIELAELGGLVLDDWQRYVLTHALGERSDGQWAAFEVGILCSRQNGKGAVLMARELAALYLLGERLVIHSAHLLSTSLEHFRRLLTIIEDTPEFDRRVQRVSKAHGEEGIELKSGQRIRFRTRTAGGARGFSADVVVVDEAMVVSDAMHAALVPTVSAHPNPQLWYAGSAVDQRANEHGVVWARLRERGIGGDDPSLAFFEWSVPVELARLDDSTAGDIKMWAQANPALGLRISPDHIAAERASLGPRTFAVERLGAGDWPSTAPGGESVIPAETWSRCADVSSRIEGPKSWSYDITPDRSASSIAVSGKRMDLLPHIEIVAHGGGTAWVVPRLVELTNAHGGEVFVDGYGAAASLIPELERARVRVHVLAAKDAAIATATLYDTAVAGTLKCIPCPELSSAVAGAKRRRLGDSWTWSRTSSAIDISPLCAASIALWGSTQTPKRPAARCINLNRI
jgi:hypothetical protein